LIAVRPTSLGLHVRAQMPLVAQKPDDLGTEERQDVRVDVMRLGTSTSITAVAGLIHVPRRASVMSIAKAIDDRLDFVDCPQ